MIIKDMAMLLMAAGVLLAYDDTRNAYENITYFSEVLITNVQRATNLVIDVENTVFFSYDSKTHGVIYHIASYNLNNQRFEHVEDIENGRATALDYRNDMKYFGAGQKIYAFNDNTNRAECIERVLPVQALCILDNLIFADIMGDVYQINDHALKRLEHLKAIRLLTVDRNGRLFYTNDTGLFDYNPRYNETRQYFTKKTWLLKQIAMNKYNEVYVAGSEGIFKLNQRNCTLARVGSFVGVYGLAFDMFNNMVYSNENEILRAYLSYDY